MRKNYGFFGQGSACQFLVQFWVSSKMSGLRVIIFSLSFSGVWISEFLVKRMHAMKTYIRDLLEYLGTTFLRRCLS